MSQVRCIFLNYESSCYRSIANRALGCLLTSYLLGRSFVKLNVGTVNAMFLHGGHCEACVLASHAIASFELFSNYSWYSLCMRMKNCKVV